VCESVDWTETLRGLVERRAQEIVSSNGKNAMMMEAGDVRDFCGADGRWHYVVVGTTQKASDYVDGSLNCKRVLTHVNRLI